jgi:hypothetical protein
VPPRKLLARLDRVGDVVHLAVAAAREPLPAAAAAAAAALLPLGQLDRLLAAHAQDLVLDRELLLRRGVLELLLQRLGVALHRELLVALVVDLEAPRRGRRRV